MSSCTRCLSTCGHPSPMTCRPGQRAELTGITCRTRTHTHTRNRQHLFGPRHNPHRVTARTALCMRVVGESRTTRPMYTPYTNEVYADAIPLMMQVRHPPASLGPQSGWSRVVRGRGGKDQQSLGNPTRLSLTLRRITPKSHRPNQGVTRLAAATPAIVVCPMIPPTPCLPNLHTTALINHDWLLLPLLALALGPLLMPGLTRLYRRRRDRIWHGNRLDVRREGFERG